MSTSQPVCLCISEIAPDRDTQDTCGSNDMCSSNFENKLITCISWNYILDAFCVSIDQIVNTCLHCLSIRPSFPGPDRTGLSHCVFVCLSVHHMCTFVFLCMHFLDQARPPDSVRVIHPCDWTNHHNGGLSILMAGLGQQRDVGG